MEWYYRNTVAEKGKIFAQIKISLLKQLPIKKASEDEQKMMIDLVNEIRIITKTKSYLQNPAKQAQVQQYEKQIDRVVYKLYSLTPKEIKIIKES